MVYKKIIGLVFFFILLSLLPASFAGRQAMLAKNHLEKQDMSATYEEEVNVIHERVLRANTKDYAKYDPSPTFVKPPFKLIPN
nr:protein CASPARIAN STRIP INTEGRITY FACTOR 1 [Ipomoea batatas]